MTRQRRCVLQLHWVVKGRKTSTLSERPLKTEEKEEIFPHDRFRSHTEHNHELHSQIGDPHPSFVSTAPDGSMPKKEGPNDLSRCKFINTTGISMVRSGSIALAPGGKYRTPEYAVRRSHWEGTLAKIEGISAESIFGSPFAEPQWLGMDSHQENMYFLSCWKFPKGEKGKKKDGFGQRHHWVLCLTFYGLYILWPSFPPCRCLL